MNFFVKLPEQLFDDLRDGRVDTKMFLILAWLFRRADWATGVVRRVSAKRIKAEVWGDEHEHDTLSERSIQEKIKRLGLMGRLTSHHVDGRRGSYAVTLHNYPALDSAGKDVAVNPKETIGLDELRDMLCADSCGEPSGEVSGETAGSLPAKLPRIRDYVQDSSQDFERDPELDSDQEEISKEVSNPLAPLAGKSLAPEKTNQEQQPFSSASKEEQPHDESWLLTLLDGCDAATLAGIWQQHNGSPLAEDETSLARALVSNHGLDDVGAVLLDTFACPALRKIPWTDFRVWARNYALNRTKVLAWRRSLGEDKANARELEAKTKLADHKRSAEQEAFARIRAELAVPDDFRCPYCQYGEDGERTRWCRDCFDEMRGEGESVCELGLGWGECPACLASTPGDGWEYCRVHGCVRCGRKATHGGRVCESCSEQPEAMVGNLGGRAV